MDQVALSKCDVQLGHVLLCLLGLIVWFREFHSCHNCLYTKLSGNEAEMTTLN